MSWPQGGVVCQRRRTEVRAGASGARAVFKSGYTAELIATHGGLGADVAFLRKPFTIDALRTVVQTALRRAQ